VSFFESTIQLSSSLSSQLDFNDTMHVFWKVYLLVATPKCYIAVDTVLPTFDILDHTRWTSRARLGAEDHRHTSTDSLESADSLMSRPHTLIATGSF
jgi:hypothetical protein